jgi:hypothetical protein
MTNLPTANRPRSGVTELRQYTHVPGRRDALIELFDDRFLDGQEAVGMHVPGQFRDLDDPDRFVWLRGFDDMSARDEALTSFYDGPLWAANRDAANATLVDSDDVLLLAPVHLEPDYPVYGQSRPPVGAHDVPESVVFVTVLCRNRRIDDELSRFFLDVAMPILGDTGASPLAVFGTDPSPNTFPRLPVRDDNVLVWASRFDSDADLATHRASLARSSTWTSAVLPRLYEGLTGAPQELRLRPTARSQLR